MVNAPQNTKIHRYILYFGMAVALMLGGYANMIGNKQLGETLTSTAVTLKAKADALEASGQPEAAAAVNATAQAVSESAVSQTTK